MVQKAMILPDGVVENVAHRCGEVSIEAVTEAYTEDEIAEFQRRAVDGDVEVTVLAALDGVEMERVEEAAAEAGQHHAVWLADAAVDVVEESGPVARPERLGEQVERVIFRRSEI